jgi:hypothetical protein
MTIGDEKNAAELIRAREFVTHVVRDIFHQETDAATIEKAAREIAKAMSRGNDPQPHHKRTLPNE